MTSGQTNFFLASSAVVPILAVALLLEVNLRPVKPADPPAWLSRLLRRMDTESAEAAVKGATASPILYGALAAWAEFTCLRSLEREHIVWPGTILVWITLGLFTFSLIVNAWGLALPDSPDDPRSAPGRGRRSG